MATAEQNSSPVVEPSKPRLLKVLGPGLITGASDDDPSGIATYSQAGAQFGFSITWTLLLTLPLMAVIQEIAGRIGRASGLGLAGVISKNFPAWVMQTIVFLLFFANIINIGADLGAMGDAVKLIIGGPSTIYVVIFGFSCVLMQVFMKYKRYVSVLKWLTISLFAYFGTVLAVNVPWSEALRGLVIPTFNPDPQFWTVVVAILGTTISPYLFFWQAAQEVEDLGEKPTRTALIDAPKQAPKALARIRTDTVVGMAFSNLVALAIVITAAATLNANGVTDVQSSAQAAEALKPVAGQFAFSIFALGIIGTGLLAVPVLGGSAAYALGEVMKWPVGLARPPKEAKAFYATLSIATLAGVALDFTPIDPIKALFWSAVVNGVVAVPVMAIMMIIAVRDDVMGKGSIPTWMTVVGWTATGIMALAALAMGALSLM
ncbi:divalent metal cation transporter [Bosea sp. (in: a-proteobacteria)]|uniref:NRAMP family divalent metal transporter n=1 Tax=Bosea sp. (in: a-proteobacteria) TaxID=1871050 RepID=UPI00120A67F3|nr:divalent metal cation transporter [Bosea sp. (in: a-proteobacteria)]TAJ31765.1 MAG: divalent metal cation transporter [Bosea sp. (in: a-proteobacteria)]